MACATAMPMGCHAADTVLRTLRGQAPAPFGFAYMARCVSLGRRQAVVQLLDGDDRPRPTAIRGLPGAWVKEVILRAAAAMPSWEASSGAPLYAWPRGAAA
jgi:NADH dehydrogenase FAD-containing subunit